MADTAVLSVWMGRLTFLCLALVLVFLRLLPLDTLPPGWAGPDLLLAAVLVWTVRRPRLVPVALVAAVFLLTDLLFQRPPGLQAAAVVVATEMLRRRHARLRSGGFAQEWLAVSVAIAGVILAPRLALLVTLVPPAPLPLTLMQVLATMLAYPAVALVAQIIFGVARTARGTADSRRIGA